MDDLRAYALDLFGRHLDTMADEVQNRNPFGAETAERVGIMTRRFREALDVVESDTARRGRLHIIDICAMREDALRAAGIDDVYKDAKERENRAAIELYDRVVSDLDAMSPPKRAHAVIQGIFAGNIFDLGATETVERFRETSVDFLEVRRQLRPRPWLVDDLDGWLRRREGPPHRSAVLFVDNAGTDVILGMIPFARQLLRDGTDVLLTANTTPSLNDVTHDELAALVDELAGRDVILADALADGRLELVPSGNGLPLIDLTLTGFELAEAVTRRRVDLVVLEGMGRAVESNFQATFTCDALKIAMLKDAGIAKLLDGVTYDLVLRFDEAGAAEGE
ncbi:MAG: hypothetical protein CMJ18_19680 [Phycisphaeraceae bacterium]|nr:hypothetical protein [Phycisphaeraceae bacterium]